MKIKLVTLLFLFGLAAPAIAGGFEHYDKDADGYISAEELGEKKAHKLQKMDTNQDQLISKEEFKAYKDAKRNKLKDTY